MCICAGLPNNLPFVQKMNAINIVKANQHLQQQ